MNDSPNNDQSQPIEYSVYSLKAAPQGEGNDNDPEKHLTTEDMDQALREAVVLFETGKYSKVEVKKKYFEEKTGRTIEMTLREFEAKEKKDWTLFLLIVLSVACGAGAFALTFFLL